MKLFPVLAGGVWLLKWRGLSFFLFPAVSCKAVAAPSQAISWHVSHRAIESYRSSGTIPRPRGPQNLISQSFALVPQLQCTLPPASAPNSSSSSAPTSRGPHSHSQRTTPTPRAPRRGRNSKNGVFVCGAVFVSPPFSFPHYHIPFSPNLDPETSTATVDGPLPYYVHRTPTGNLPVYQEIRSGGNRHQTRIRRVEGDLQFLIRQIHEALELDKKDIIFNSLTSQVVIKGREKERVLELFKYLRF